MTLNEVISIIKDELDMQQEYSIGKYTKCIEFEQWSYTISALEELERYLLKHPKQKIIDVIEDFRHITDTLACSAKTKTANYMFSVYYDVTSYILDRVVSDTNIFA